jgi:hypothetical protein
MMQKRVRFSFIGAIGILVLLVSCAARAYLMVDYQVPMATQQLTGQTVRLIVKDMRTIKTVMSPGAAQLFSDFRDRYSLTWITPENQRILAGEYPLTDLFYNVFAKRLQQLGAAVTDDVTSDAARFTVTITKFNVNLLGVKWYASLTCEASLTPDGQLEAKETVTGSAERARIVGRKGADTVLSDIFSDVLNRIDIVNLFQKTKLI